MSDEFREKIAGEITLAAEPGKTIRKWREEFGLSQNQLAEAMGVSHSVISDYESGRRKSPGAGLIKKLVNALIDLDKEAGSPTISKYVPEAMSECIIAMGEFRNGVPMDQFISEKLDIPVLLARDPADCCILGIGYLTENIQLVTPQERHTDAN